MPATVHPSDLETTMVYKILASLKTIVGVRFSISKEIFFGTADYDALVEDRYIDGEFK